MPQLKIIIDSNSPEEKETFESWFKHWESQLSSVSPDKGCGCCVNIFEVEATKEAIDDFNNRFEALYRMFIENAPRKSAKDNRTK